MRVARIVDGIVENIEVWPDGAPLPENAVACDRGVSKGMLYAGGTFTAPPVAPQPVVLTPLELLSRLTPGELSAITVAAMNDPGVAQWQTMLLAAGEIRSDDQRTLDGIAFAVSKGILTAERAAEVMS